MNRREMVRLLSGALAAPLAAGLPAERLAALGRSVHARARGRALQVLDPHQSETVATIAEMIIPATDTPGARAARVHEFIDLILAEWDGDDDRARFLSGLADVDTRCRDAFGADFLGAAAAQRTAVLAGLDAEVTALRAASASPEKHFFQRMKSLTLFGYYTSEVGATQELRYETIPGSFDGCADAKTRRAAPGDF